MAGVAEETTESRVDDASKPEMEKAVAEELKEDTPSAVVEIAAPKYQSTEVTAVENAEVPDDTPEDRAVDGEEVQVVQGERDRGQDPQYETPDDGGGAVVP